MSTRVDFGTTLCFAFSISETVLGEAKLRFGGLVTVLERFKDDGSFRCSLSSFESYSLLVFISGSSQKKGMPMGLRGVVRGLIIATREVSQVVTV